MQDCSVYLFCAYNRCRYHRLDSGSVPNRVFELGPLHSRRKLATEAHFINTAAMNQRLQSDNDGAHQTLKNTKAKMREVLAKIAAILKEHGQPQDGKVSTVLDLFHLLGLMAPRHSHSQNLPISARLL